MERYDIPREELQGILAQLEQALLYYQQWHAPMIRDLPCLGDPHDFSPEAHRECRFGQWYYDNVPERLRKLPGFSALDKAHAYMHQLAAKLLSEAQEGTPALFDDDNLSNALDCMHLEISALECPYDKVLMQHAESVPSHDSAEHLREGLALLSMDFDRKAPIRITTSFGAVLRLFMHQA